MNPQRIFDSDPWRNTAEIPGDREESREDSSEELGKKSYAKFLKESLDKSWEESQEKCLDESLEKSQGNFHSKPGRILQKESGINPRRNSSENLWRNPRKNP